MDLFSKDQSKSSHLLEDESVIYLVDGREAQDVNARTLLVISPRISLYNDFIKLPGTIIRYMPIWSGEEIEACRV